MITTILLFAKKKKLLYYGNIHGLAGTSVGLGETPLKFDSSLYRFRWTDFEKTKPNYNDAKICLVLQGLTTNF